MSYLSFLDVSFDSFRFCVFDIKKDKIIFAKEGNKEPRIVREVVFTGKENIFRDIIKVIDEAEKFLKVIIIDVIFLLKDNNLKIEKADFVKDFINFKRVNAKDINEVKKSINIQIKEESKEDEVILQPIFLQYFLDNNSLDIKTKSFGKILSISILHSSIKRATLEPIIHKFEEFKLRIKNFISYDCCSVLNLIKEEKNVLFLDFGAYFTSYTFFNKKNNLLRRNSFKIGNFDITNDIIKTFHITFKEAEFIKLNINSLMLKELDYEISLRNGGRKIKSSDVINVVKVRIEEILQILKKDLTKQEIEIENIYISWKNSQSEILKNSINKILNINSKIQKINYLNIDDFNVEKMNFEPIFSAIETYKCYIIQDEKTEVEEDEFKIRRFSCFLKKIFY